MAMIAAEVLGLGIDEVRPMVADTDSIGYTDVTAGSRVTFATGMAVYNAAQDAVRQFKERAAKLMDKKPDELEFHDGAFAVKGNGAKPMKIKELAGRLARAGGPVTGRATVNARGAAPTFAATCVDVEVDPEATVTVFYPFIQHLVLHRGTLPATSAGRLLSLRLISGSTRLASGAVLAPGPIPNPCRLRYSALRPGLPIGLVSRLSGTGFPSLRRNWVPGTNMIFALSGTPL